MFFIKDGKTEYQIVVKANNGINKNITMFEWNDTNGLKYIMSIMVTTHPMFFLNISCKVLKRSDIVREGTVSDIDLGDYLLQEGMIEKEYYDLKQVEAKELVGV